MIREQLELLAIGLLLALSQRVHGERLMATLNKWSWPDSIEAKA